ncbi:hypothetical protein ABT127_34895 [Streptomyces sp. NPDC001904]|uniref:TolB family protein n=1 Tax=Streptomyces sp. NPDC001904 TaxID=3154531 RepID=UPI00332D7778
MTELEIVARVQSNAGHAVERLVCHPRLPLFACLDSVRPAVGIWACDSGTLRQLGSMGTDSAVYSEALGWERSQRTPAVAWHPHEAELMVAGEGTLTRWQPSGLTRLDSSISAVHYNDLAFSPDGRTLWASPSSGDDDAWERSDVLDLGTGTVTVGPRWDTGITEHPGGSLVATLASDQGATLGLFARASADTTPAVMRLRSHALILDCDGYEAPIFSPDGRHLAIRGNAYGNSLDVFEFPSLCRVFSTSLGEPSPGYPYPEEWLRQMRAWSRHNIAFGTRHGVLWIGTPAGALVQVDIKALAAQEHNVLAGAPVSALGRTATDELVMASSTGELVLLAMGTVPVSVDDGEKTTPTPREAVADFLDATTELPDDADLDTDLVLTDGSTTWNSEDLAAINTASVTDPTWLQIRAAMGE